MFTTEWKFWSLWWKDLEREGWWEKCWSTSVRSCLCSVIKCTDLRSMTDEAYPKISGELVSLCCTWQPWIGTTWPKYITSPWWMGGNIAIWNNLARVPFKIECPRKQLREDLQGTHPSGRIEQSNTFFTEFQKQVALVSQPLKQSGIQEALVGWW